MKRGQLYLSLFLGCLSIIGCGTAKKVPLATMTAQGSYELIEFSANKDKSMLNARTSANTFCASRKQGMAMVLSEETIYQGLIDERLNQTAQKAGQIGSGVLGSNKATDSLGKIVSNEDYKTMIEFKCELGQ